MKLTINGTAYPCVGRPHFTDPVRFNLPEGKPDVTALGDTLILQSDDGEVLRTVDISGITERRYFDGGFLIVTNTLEPIDEEPTESTPTLEDRVSACETAIEAIITEDTGVTA